MNHTRRTELKPERWYRGAEVPMRLIRRFARQVVEQFQPDRIILFGSYAYGQPHADSDVDILVVMPARNQVDQAAKIHQAILPPFPLDIIVRTPGNMKWRLEEGDSFLKEVVDKGKVLYEKADQGRNAVSRRQCHKTPSRSCGALGDSGSGRGSDVVGCRVDYASKEQVIRITQSQDAASR